MSEKERVQAELQQLEVDIQRARDDKSPMLAELLKKKGRRQSQLAYCEYLEQWLMRLSE